MQKSLKWLIVGVCGVAFSQELLKPARPQRKSVNALKEECARLCEKSLDLSIHCVQKVLDCQKETLRIVKQIIDDETLSRKELEASIDTLHHMIRSCESMNS